MNISGLLRLLKKNNKLVPQSLRTKLSHYIYEYLFPVSDRLGQDGERCLSILEVYLNIIIKTRFYYVTFVVWQTHNQV